MEIDLDAAIEQIISINPKVTTNPMLKQDVVIK